ncbi:bifunctional riboflavin kinase/FAD synthetase [Rothia sp. P5764]|uniref:bifunctional riboflavin kinase/FAD synthetase n=1 Tax=unclassified Rothia (in: high G+C Gram-positive bacteria) TaxID=2689056 RepID=UPI003AC4FFDB
MKRYTDLAQIPAGYGPTVVTIGNFDGVHIGHQKVLSTLVATAQERGLTSVAVSFDPHPAVVHGPAGSHVDIMGQKDRQAVMAELGVDVYLLLHYDLDFAAQTPEEFVTRTFVDALDARCVVIGDDVRFGTNNSGNLATMKELGQRFGFDVVVVEDLLVSDASRCSSTAIRQLLGQGRVAEAGSLLGRSHYMRGEVVHGAARGRELGFPTANLSADSKGLVPADGVYAGWLIDEQEIRHPVAISVGTNPTFEGITTRQVEAHVIDRTDEKVEDFNLYGQQITLEFVAFLRGMVAYTGVEALVEQMYQDVEQARQILS